jgi:hypothetical protein
MLSEEKFMKNNLKFLDMLKFRASWGRVGDDSLVLPWQRFGMENRFLYKDQLSYGGNTLMGEEQTGIILELVIVIFPVSDSLDWPIRIFHGKL